MNRKSTPDTPAWRASTHRVCWLASALTLLVLPHVTRSPWWIFIVFAALVAWRIGAAQGTLKATPTWVRLLVSIGIFAGVYLSHGTILGQQPGVTLLVGLAGLKIAEVRKLRDVYAIVFLAGFLAITTFLFAETILAAVYICAAMLVVTGALVVSNCSEDDQRIIAPLKRSTTLVAQAFPLMLLLFILFPRIPGPLWGLPKDAQKGITGLSDSMTVGDISHLSLSDAVAFRVAFDGEIPAARDLYWRGPVLWHTDGRRWRAGKQTWNIRSPGLEVTDQATDYEVTLEPHGQRWLFGLEMPGYAPKGARISGDFQIAHARAVRKRIKYTLRSYRRYKTRPPSTAEIQRALELPDGLHQKARALALGWRASDASPMRIAEKALQYFRDQPFYYTLSPPRLGGDTVDDFLFDTRRGFCEHYAATFTVLMRAAGVPARVITGYQGGELNSVGDYLTVRQRDAHAWSEIWVNGAGWIRVDPTAAVAPERVERGLEAALPERRAGAAIRNAGGEELWQAWQNLRQTWDALDNVWNQWVLGYGPKTQREFLWRLGIDAQDWRQLGLTMLIALGSVCTLVLLWLFRTHMPADPISAAYTQFCRRLAKVGLTRKPCEGPIDYLSRVVSLRPDLTRQARLITDIYVDLRYGKGGADIKALRRAVQQFKPTRIRVS